MSELTAVQINNLFVADDWKEPTEVCGSGCPWTGDSYGVDMGCLPHPVDFIKAATEKGEILSCHSDYSIPCTGIKDYLERRKIDISKLTLVDNLG
jgi:hypothetical protein